MPEAGHSGLFRTEEGGASSAGPIEWLVSSQLPGRSLQPVFSFFASLASAHAQVRSRIVQAVDDSHLTTLAGNTHPLARSEFDRGFLDDAAPLHRMVLVLKRSAEQETALKQLIDQQQDKSSSNYLQWLTPESFGAAFGPSDRDLSTVTTWLTSHGFADIQINAGHTFVEFDGNVGAVRTAFHTNIHRYEVHGQERFANASDPAIPTALAPVVVGVASLNNFPRKAANRRLGNFRRDLTTHVTTRLPDSTSKQIQADAALFQPSFTLGGGSNTSYAVSPYDFATIYNVLPLWDEHTYRWHRPDHRYRGADRYQSGRLR